MRLSTLCGLHRDVRNNKSEGVTIEKNFKKNINMFEILILKFRLVLFMILHSTIAHVQYVSALVVDIRLLHISPTRT
jgi:hypothetical protein